MFGVALSPFVDVVIISTTKNIYIIIIFMLKCT